MRISFFLLLSILISACHVQNETVWQDGPSLKPTTRSAPSNDIGKMPNKPGACFAKSQMPGLTTKEFVAVLPIYTGEAKINEVELDTIDLQLQEGGTEWVKKKADLNCLSADPDDCLVWCLVEKETIVEQFIVVKDTSQSKHFKMTEIFNEVQNYEGNLAWVEVLCASKLTTSLINEVQGFLSQNNYLSGTINGKMNNKTKEALKKYQKENSLPIGQLDFQTLDLMGIGY